MLSEARGWLREHRSGLVTLSSLAGGMKLPEGTFAAEVAAADAEAIEAGNRRRAREQAERDAERAAAEAEADAPAPSDGEVSAC